MVDIECIYANDNTICSHLKKFYFPEIAQHPIMYWVLDIEEVKKFYSESTIHLEQQISERGDICHYNIKGIPDKKEVKFFDTYFPKATKSLCKGDVVLDFTENQYELITNLN